MKLRSLALEGFGRLAKARFTFGDGLTVVHGPNEAGKSTVAAAIVASLYGLPRGRKDDWRPWTAEPYAATLVYELVDGRTFEVQRDFARDAKGVRVYDRDGNDVAAQLSVGKTVAPGEVHLQIPHDAFVNASCVLQQAVAIDGERSGSIATALARALDGGPKEDAALGAIDRLEAVRRQFVGSPRATVNVPLRALREGLASRETAAQGVREVRDRLATVRERRADAAAERARIVARRSAAERDLKAVRAAELRTRLGELHEYREELAARNAERARYDDVAGFAVERMVELERAYYAWEGAENLARNADDDVSAARLSAPAAAELAERIADAGALDDVEFAALQEAARGAEVARAKASAAANVAAAARIDGRGGHTLAGATLLIAIVASVMTVAFAIGHWWAFTEAAAPVAAVALLIVILRARDRMRRARVAARKQVTADEDLAAERNAASAVAAVLDRIGVASVDELGRRRERLAELQRTVEHAELTVARAAAARANERTLAAAFDALADELVPDALASRALRRQVAHERAARRRQRDGIDSAIAMLALRRSEILRGADEFVLTAERDALAAAGIIPADEYVAGRSEELSGLIQELERSTHAAEITIAELTRELALGEAAVADLATLEETVERMRGEVAQLDAFDRAVGLAIATIERFTREAHQAFARRLETYAAESLAGITGGRYGELHVDPKTLDVRVRVPETGAIVGLDSLSAGTRDQVYLIVRFAMARMFGEGLEAPPLLLDDPFAYWDETRIERCLPLIKANAVAAQTILFTSSDELAAAAQAIGATRIDLAPVVLSS